MIFDTRTMTLAQHDVLDRSGNPFVAVLIYESKRVVSAYAGVC